MLDFSDRPKAILNPNRIGIEGEPLWKSFIFTSREDCLAYIRMMNNVRVLIRTDHSLSVEDRESHTREVDSEISGLVDYMDREFPIR